MPLQPPNQNFLEPLPRLFDWNGKLQCFLKQQQQPKCDGQGGRVDPMELYAGKTTGLEMKNLIFIVLYFSLDH